MSEVVGEQFIDYGNAPECVVTRVAAHEYLDGGQVRLYCCKEFGGKLVLDHTTLMTRSAIASLGKKCLEIASAPETSAPWTCSMMSELPN